MRHHLFRAQFLNLKVRSKLRSLLAQSVQDFIVFSVHILENRDERNSMAPNFKFEDRNLNKCLESWQVCPRFLTCLLARIIFSLLKKFMTGSTSEETWIWENWPILLKWKAVWPPGGEMLSCLKTSAYRTNCPRRQNVGACWLPLMVSDPSTIPGKHRRLAQPQWVPTRAGVMDLHGSETEWGRQTGFNPAFAVLEWRYSEQDSQPS